MWPPAGARTRSISFDLLQGGADAPQGALLAQERDGIEQGWAHRGPGDRHADRLGELAEARNACSIACGPCAKVRSIRSRAVSSSGRVSRVRCLATALSS